VPLDEGVGMARGTRAWGVVAVLVVLGLTACSSSSRSTSPPSTRAVRTTTTTQKSSLNGTLDVFAGTSLREAFKAEGKTLQRLHRGLSITYNFAGSQALAQQIQQGAPADVFASADTKNMQRLVAAGLVETPQIFARNKLEIAVAPGNPKHITTLSDLERPDVVLVLADGSVPAGHYAREAFRNAGLPAPKPRSNELDVKSTLARLTSGEADAVVVYTTDVEAAGSNVQGVAIPDHQNVVARYPIAVVKTSPHRDAARAFVNEIVHGTGQQALAVWGFLPPT
jgi:molybdate transport system substrate-binding protein